MFKIIDEITTETQAHRGSRGLLALCFSVPLAPWFKKTKKLLKREAPIISTFNLQFSTFHFSLIHSSCIGSPLELSPLCVHTFLATLPLKFNDAPTLELSLEKNSIFSVYFPFVKV